MQDLCGKRQMDLKCFAESQQLDYCMFFKQGKRLKDSFSDGASLLHLSH